MTDQRDHLKPRVLPGLVVLCVYLALLLFQNAMILRRGLDIWDRAYGPILAMLNHMLAFALVELVLGFAAIVLLMLVRRSFVPFVGAAALLLCGTVGYWLQNLVLAPYREGRPIVEISGPWGLLDIVITLCGAVWLLKSRNVRDFFDPRLVARTFD